MKQVIELLHTAFHPRPGSRLSRLGLFVSIPMLLAACGGGAQLAGPGDVPPPDPEALAVLFIGNSLTYTNDLPGLLRSLLETHQDADVHIESLSYPNWGLPDHWVSGPARARIAAGGWDVVVLQQGPSATEGRPYLLDYGARFAAEIKQSGAAPAFFMVWPSAQRSFDFDGVSDSYATAARQTGSLLFPGGEAWRMAWEDDERLALYGTDGFHPSLLGSYLAAVVMALQLTDVAPEDLGSVIRTGGGDINLDPAVAQLLHSAAAGANTVFALPAMVSTPRGE